MKTKETSKQEKLDWFNNLQADNKALLVNYYLSVNDTEIELIYDSEHSESEIQPAFDRKTAMQYWNNLPDITIHKPSKSNLCRKYYGDMRTYNSLTHREIEEIWNQEMQRQEFILEKPSTPTPVQKGKKK